MTNPKTHPDLRIFADKESLTSAAAQVFAAAATQAVAARGRFLVILSGGSTPQALFTLLASPTYQTDIPWEAVHLFWGDERLVPPDDPGSNYYHARRLLLDQVRIPDAQIHRVRGELSSRDAVEDYRRQLKDVANDTRAWPRVDLALMGMGSDGHTASLFPGSSAVFEKNEPVLPVTADYGGRPARRVTLTPPVFNDARQVLFLVTGADKAEAVSAVLRGPHNLQKWPAQGIQPVSQNLAWFLDASAAEQINP